MFDVGRKFVDLCLSGDALAEDVFNFIGQWHESDTDESLPEFLGFTDDEYALWVERPRCLDIILHARNTGTFLKEVRTQEQAYRMAARSLSPHDAVELTQWLKKTGRISD